MVYNSRINTIFMTCHFGSDGKKGIYPNFVYNQVCNGLGNVTPFCNTISIRVKLLPLVAGYVRTKYLTIIHTKYLNTKYPFCNVHIHHFINKYFSCMICFVFKTYEWIFSTILVCTQILFKVSHLHLFQRVA